MTTIKRNDDDDKTMPICDNNTNKIADYDNYLITIVMIKTQITMPGKNIKVDNHLYNHDFSLYSSLSVLLLSS